MNRPLDLLMIEDEEADFLLLVRHLQAGGLGAHCTRVASNPELAAALDTHTWDAVLIDYSVPGMGFESSLAMIRRPHPDLPVIVVSGALGEERAVELMRLGANDFVPKDRPIRLVPTIERCLREAAQQRAHAAAEAALRASEERLQLAMEISRSYAFEWSPDSDQVRRSAASGAILGLTGEAAEHDTGQGYFQRVAPADRERFLALVQSLRPGLDRYRTEYRLTRGDGETIVLEETARAFFDAQDRLQRLVGAVADITERKRAEALLAEQAQQLREADRRKDEFLAMLAHELRNPLAPIVNAVQILKAGGLSDGQLAWCRDLIERQTGHLTRLVDDLLDISRITRGKIALHQAPLAVADIVQRALETSRPLIDARGQRIEVHLPAEPTRVQGDLIRLAQALSNLLNNAAKYTDDGGLIQVQVEAGPDMVAITVRDNGRGIDPAVASRLFDLFYQAERTLDRAEGGLGVGLSLVERLVSMHGGSVRAFSAGLGQGSEFVIRLPRLPEPPAAMPPAATRATPVGDRPLILIADDNPDVADSLALVLRIQGWPVTIAYDGPTALALASSARPGVVLLDIGLPGLDGYAVGGAIRRDAELQATWVIAVTGYGQSQDRERSKAAGFDAHLVKPLDWEALQGLLAEVLKGPPPGRGRP